MRYSSSDLFGYAALTFTFYLNVRAEGGVGCKDLQGRSYESGFHYIPGPEPCTFCVCDNGNPKWCKAVICKFPEQEDCKSFRRGDTCCEFFCLDDTLSSISNEKTDGPGGNVTEGNTNFDIGLRSVASFVTAILSMSLLFFLIHRLRQRKIRVCVAGRQSRQLTEEQRNLGNMGYLERGGLQHGVPMDDMPCGGGYPLWKPPGNYFPRGEAPPPYEEAVAAARAEQALLSISPHTLSPLNFQTGFFANSNNHSSVAVVGTAHPGLSPSSPLSANNNPSGTNTAANGSSIGTGNVNPSGSVSNTAINTVVGNSSTATAAAVAAATTATITATTTATTTYNTSHNNNDINNINNNGTGSGNSNATGGFNNNNNNFNNSSNNHHSRLSSSSTSINVNNNNNNNSGNAASASPITSSSANRPLSSPTTYSGYHQAKKNDMSASASLRVGTSTGNFTIVDTGTYENLPASAGIVPFHHQYPAASGNSQSFPSSHSTISKNYRQHATTSLPRQNGGAFTISTGASSTAASGGVLPTPSVSAALQLSNTNVSTHRTIPRTLTSRTGTRMRSIVNDCAPDSEFFHLSPVPAPTPALTPAPASAPPDKVARSTRSTVSANREEPTVKSQQFYKEPSKDLPSVTQRSDKQVANSNEGKACDFKRPLNLANEINEDGSFESVTCTCSMQALPTLHDDADDYRSECENCKSATGSRYYLDNEDELVTSPHETMTLHRRPEEAGSSNTPQYYRTSLTLPTSTRQRTRSTSVRENWFNTMPQSSTESSDEN